jgi:hypothetical protein
VSHPDAYTLGGSDTVMLFCQRSFTFAFKLPHRDWGIARLRSCHEEQCRATAWDTVLSDPSAVSYTNRRSVNPDTASLEASAKHYRHAVLTSTDRTGLRADPNHRRLARSLLAHVNDVVVKL